MDLHPILIPYLIAFIISLVIIAWGFYTVDKTTMAKSEKIVWKVLFFFAPPIALILFLLLRRKNGKTHFRTR